MAREQAPGVLDLHVPLQHRLEQIAGRLDERHHEAEHDGLADRQEVLAVERDEGHEHGRRDARDEALPRLAGREHGREPVAPDQPADEVCERVRGPDREQHRERDQPAVHRQGA